MNDTARAKAVNYSQIIVHNFYFIVEMKSLSNPIDEFVKQLLTIQVGMSFQFSVFEEYSVLSMCPCLILITS